MIVYKVLNKENDMSYIGQTTKSLENRKKVHEIKTNHTDFYFHRALKKYGLEHFSWEIIKKCKTKVELDYWEKRFIEKLKTKAPNGYNMTSGGEGNPNRIVRDETRLKLRIINTGKHHSEETRKKLREARKRNPNPNKGRKFSKEWRENLSKAHEGQDLSHLSSHQFKKGNVPWSKGKKLNEAQKARLNMEGLKLGNKARWNKRKSMDEKVDDF